MTEQQLDTEEQIFEAACRVFQRKGFAGARMQEIADEADINKSMLHYYYRSKDKLFTKVYQREMTRFFPVLFGVMDSDDPMDQKVEQLVEVYYSFLNDNPQIAQFMVTEMNQNPERFRAFIESQGVHPSEKFIDQIKGLIQDDRMDDIPPEQLMVSIVGLVLFPFIVSPMVRAIFDFEEQEFLHFLKDRRAFLVDFILNAINYQKK